MLLNGFEIVNKRGNPLTDDFFGFSSCSIGVCLKLEPVAPDRHVPFAMNTHLGPAIYHLNGPLAREYSTIPQTHLGEVCSGDCQEFSYGSITFGLHAMAGGAIVHEIPAPQIRRNWRLGICRNSWHNNQNE